MRRYESQNDGRGANEVGRGVVSRMEDTFAIKPSKFFK